MRVVVDQAVPYLSHFFSSDTAVMALPASQIDADRLRGVDGLLVRSVTRVDAQLLAQTSLQWVATATAGVDHIDAAHLAARQIPWVAAPGCNADAVADYVLLCLAEWCHAQGWSLRGRVAAVVGVGWVGRAVAQLLEQLGMRVLRYDPPRASREPTFVSCAESDLWGADLLCMHLPYTTTGPDATHHWLNADRLMALPATCLIINAGRGGCVDMAALHQAPQPVILDVWSNEPEIVPTDVARAWLATPHIAGYSAAAKFSATERVHQQLVQLGVTGICPVPLPRPPHLPLCDIDQAQWVSELRNIIPLLSLSAEFKTAVARGEPAAEFTALRRHYPLRPAFVLHRSDEI